MDDIRLNKGRWWRIFIESNGSEYVCTDENVINFSSNHMKLNGINPVIVSGLYDFTTTEKAVDVTTGIHLYSDGSIAVTLPPPNTFNSGYIYIFGERV